MAGPTMVSPEYRLLRWLMPFPAIEQRNLRLVRRATDLSARATRPVDGVTASNQGDGGAQVRVYRPAAVSAPAAVLWVHGGGLIIGRPEMDDQRASGIAAALGVVVVSVRYRLAPEHPFPTPLDDVQAGWDWLQRHAESLGVDPQRVVIGGGSAGAGLVAALTQRLRDADGRQPVGQLLVYPMLDDHTAADRSLDEPRHAVWSNGSNRTGWSSYLAGGAGRDDVPAYAVPARREDLSRLPPAWIGVGTADLFHDEVCTYAERLQAAGVPVELVVVEGAPHGFDAVTAPRASQDFLASQLAFLSERLELPPDLPTESVLGLPTLEWVEQAPIRVEQTVEIAAPPSAVWPFIADHAGWTRWFTAANSVVVTGRGSGVGGRRRVRIGALRFDEVFTAWEPERHFAFAISSSTLPILARMAESLRVEPTTTGTRVTYRQGLAAHRRFESPLQLVARRLSAELADSLVRLKSMVEGEE